MKNSNDTIGNRARELSACSAVPQPTALPRAPTIRITLLISRRALHNGQPPSAYGWLNDEVLIGININRQPL